MKQVFHKVNKIACEARKLLESQMVVLEYRTVEAEEPAPGSPAASEQVLYGHVGHVNFSTWHHVLLRLTADMQELGLPSELSESTGALQVGAVPAEAAGNALGAFSDLQFYKQLDLKRAWEVRPHVISVMDNHWHSLDSSASPVPLLPLAFDSDANIAQYCSWLGSEAEKAIRSQDAEAKTANRKQSGKKRGPRTPASKPPGKRLRTKTSAADAVASALPGPRPADAEADAARDEGDLDDGRGVGPVDFGEPAGDQGLAASEPAGVLELEPDNPYLEPLQDLLLDPDGEPVAAEVEEHLEKSSLGSVESDIAASELSLGEAQADLPEDGGDQDLLLELEQEFQAEKEVRPRADAGDVGLDLLDAPVGLPARAAPGPRAEPSDEARAPAQPRRPRVEADREEFRLGDYGVIRFNRHSKTLFAICPRHAKCQMERTCRPTVRDIKSASVLAGQGRPVGLLMNWLASAQEFDSQQRHVHRFVHTFSSRQESRQLFQTFEGAAAFAAAAERERREDEEEEPRRIL
ncbi:unnamed protein product [Symbiodinium sp. CCMP2592]|nr:unnamed protein product [Symbiodinium sp. CCMP2592]